MIIFLFNLPLTAGGERMAQTDPNGWTLTLISVGVVFSALIILYFVYKFSGDIFSGKFKRAPKTVPEASSASEDAAVQAAIAAALHLYFSQSCAHDIETGILTIRRTAGNWNNKALNFRKLPK